MNPFQRSSWTKFDRHTLKFLHLKELRGRYKELFVLILVGIMLFWNWKLLLATGTGMFLMVIAYNLQGKEWQGYWSNWQRTLQGVNQQFIIAVSTGGIGALTTYMAASIWVEAENRWFALNSILQSLVTIAILVLFSWQTLSRRKNQDEATWDKLLAELTHSDPLKRLISVRQLTRLVNQKQVNQSDRRQVSEYLTLMLTQKQPRIVREAILESLQTLDSSPSLQQPSQPLKMPLNLKPVSNKVHHPI